MPACSHTAKFTTGLSERHLWSHRTRDFSYLILLGHQQNADQKIRPLTPASAATGLISAQNKD
jgi:hypothetical protein